MKNVFLLFLLLAPTAYGQQPPKTYYDYVKKAGGLREQLQYKAAAQAYSAAFSVNSGGAFPEDRYNAACAWSLAGGADSAFCYLQRLVDREHYDAYVQAPADPDFIPLQKDSRWKPLLTQMRDKKDSLEALLDKPLVAQLNAVYRSDQTLRRQVETTEHKWGFQSPQMKALWAKINSNDSLNLLVVKRILDTRGWLGAAVVGQQGNATLFLVIQHADVKTQEHYLPMMRQAVLDGKAQPDNLALLEDRGPSPKWQTTALWKSDQRGPPNGSELFKSACRPG